MCIQWSFPTATELDIVYDKRCQYLDDLHNLANQYFTNDQYEVSKSCTGAIYFIIPTMWHSGKGKTMKIIKKTGGCQK